MILCNADLGGYGYAHLASAECTVTEVRLGLSSTTSDVSVYYSVRFGCAFATCCAVLCPTQNKDVLCMSLIYCVEFCGRVGGAMGG